MNDKPLLAQLTAMVEGMTDEERQALLKTTPVGKMLGKYWTPEPGPQTQAFLSKADFTLYGGAAGGGKTDLVVGLSLEAENAVVFRKQATDLRGLEQRFQKLVGAKAVNTQLHTVKLDGTLIEMGHLGKPKSELGWQGRPHDFIGFDEAEQLPEKRVSFVIGWLRSTTGRRCRIVAATNPPTDAEGGWWLFRWFAPWLDPLFPDPAKPGELRWAIIVGTDGEDGEIETVWPKESELETEIVNGETLRFQMIERQGKLTKYYALTRTYIPSLLKDNRHLPASYLAQINAQPEPRRSALLYGDWLAARKDNANQIIPTEWVRLANERFRANAGKRKMKMIAIGADIAQGGEARTVLAPLRGARFEELIKKPGHETPDGPSVASFLLTNRKDNAGIVLDMGGGWGGSTKDHLRTNHDIVAIPFLPGSKTGELDANGVFGFTNVRSAGWWKLRESLDPASGDDIELPPDSRLMAQLTAPTFYWKGPKVQVEEKEEIMKRLQTTIDEADAVVMTWFKRREAAATARRPSEDPTGAATRQRHSVPLRDPFEDL